jgi:RNA polymerase-interacting CarD/CdnL/TRCF family regulator
MQSANPNFSEGNWVVHTFYGLGQIKGQETKIINGKESTYFRVKTKDITYWVPLDQTESSRFRPLSSQREFQKAIKVLKKPAREMDSDHQARKDLIKQVRSDPSPVGIARLVRDLKARTREKSLNATEEEALNHFTERLVSEWSVCMQISPREAQQDLDRCLKHAG